jgi:hypothetical protein
MIKLILIVALALMAAPAAHAAGKQAELPVCKGKGNVPPCNAPPLKKPCRSPESGVEFPKGYMCVEGPNVWGWQCDAESGKLSKWKGGGGKRKRDAVCE